MYIHRQTKKYKLKHHKRHIQTKTKHLISKSITILNTSDAKTKAKLAMDLHNIPTTATQNIDITNLIKNIPRHPSRPDKPDLVEVKQMKSYRQLKIPQTLWLLHALARTYD